MNHVSYHNLDITKANLSGVRGKKEQMQKINLMTTLKVNMESYVGQINY